MQMLTINDLNGTNLEGCTELLADIMDLGQILCKQTQGIGEQLCQEVTRVTNGRARLLLPCQDVTAKQQIPFPVSVSFQVQFNHRNYGTLDIAPDAERPTPPALPLHLAQLLAHMCGLLLCTIEVSAIIERQYQRLDHQEPQQLTKREREVLKLICRGHNQQKIAEALGITSATVGTHRKRISEKLGVHSERDIPLAAYRANLFSILEESC